MKSKFYNEKYLNYVSTIAPKTNEKRSLLHAFWVGGTICVIGQFIRFMLEFFCGLYGDELAGTTSVVLIFIGALLTGLGVYDRIEIRGRWVYRSDNGLCKLGRVARN